MSRLRTMQVVVNGAELGRLVVIPAYLDQTHAQNQNDVLAIDNLLPHISLIPSQNFSKDISNSQFSFEDH